MGPGCPGRPTEARHSEARLSMSAPAEAASSRRALCHQRRRIPRSFDGAQCRTSQLDHPAERGRWLGDVILLVGLNCEGLSKIYTTAVVLLGDDVLTKSRSQKTKPTKSRYLATWRKTRTSLQVRKEMGDIMYPGFQHQRIEK